VTPCPRCRRDIGRPYPGDWRECPCCGWNELDEMTDAERDAADEEAEANEEKTCTLSTR